MTREQMKEVADTSWGVAQGTDGEAHERDRWHVPIGCAPRCVLLHMPGLPNGKALIEFHGILELVNTEDLYPTEESAYVGAWLAAMEQAGRIMAQATHFRERSERLRADR